MPLEMPSLTVGLYVWCVFGCGYEGCEMDSLELVSFLTLWLCSLSAIALGGFPLSVRCGLPFPHTHIGPFDAVPWLQAQLIFCLFSVAGIRRLLTFGCSLTLLCGPVLPPSFSSEVFLFSLLQVLFDFPLSSSPLGLLHFPFRSTLLCFLE